MKLSVDRPYADPEKAARKLLEIANATEAPQEGRIHIEKINGPVSSCLHMARARLKYTAGSNLRSRTAGYGCTNRDLREVHAGRRGPVPRDMRDDVTETPMFRGPRYFGASGTKAGS